MINYFSFFNSVKERFFQRKICLEFVEKNNNFYIKKYEENNNVVYYFLKK